LPEFVANYARPLEAARQDVAFIKGAGVNTIGLLIGNKHLPKSHFAPMIHAYYRVAAEDGQIKIAPDIWGELDKPDQLAMELGLLWEQYPGVWARRNGKLIMTVWLDYGNKPLPAYQDTVDRLCAKIGGRQNVFLVCYSPAELEAHNPQWFAGADAFTDWLNASYAEAHDRLNAALAAAKSAGKELWLPAMPSFTQSRPYPGVTPNVREMLGMIWYREAWLRAIRENSPAVCLQTWNDLSEDSAVMPESNHGYAFYELTKYYTAWFRSGSPPPIAEEQILLFHHPQVVEGLQLPAGRKPMEGFPVALGKSFAHATVVRTPPTDYVGVVALLKSPAKAQLLLNETVLAEQELPPGCNAWLVYQPRNQNDPRKLYPYDPERAYPRAEPGLTMTILAKPFWDAELHVSVERDGQRIGFFRSHRPIAAAAGRGDMTTVGDAFRLEK